jgi:SAM-dependent methyltransferase
MLAFFPEVIRPLLEALAPESIVEIGCESGKTTRLLVELASRVDGCVHGVDPAPKFDVERWQREARGRLYVHKLPSLVALAVLDRFDAVLIDGDHNWFTVYNELKLIELRSRELLQPLPLVFLHDVGWPYGRRDLYYDPDLVPAEQRQPWGRGGISPTEAELVAEGGLNQGMCNALREGGPRNGVLTAVEDYLAETRSPFRFVKIPAVFGLGILLPEERAALCPALPKLLDPWAHPPVERFIDRLEHARIAMLVPGLAKRGDREAAAAADHAPEEDAGPKD